jgi:hypothetical protein
VVAWRPLSTRSLCQWQLQGNSGPLALFSPLSVTLCSPLFRPLPSVSSQRTVMTRSIARVALLCIVALLVIGGAAATFAGEDSQLRRTAMWPARSRRHRQRTGTVQCAHVADLCCAAPC